MSDEFWQKYEESIRLHDAGLISDDEVNLAGARYGAYVRASAPSLDTRASKKKIGRPRESIISDLSMVPRIKPPRRSKAPRALSPEKWKQAAINEERELRWDVVYVTALRGDKRNV